MNKIYLCGDIHQEINPVYDFVDRLHERNINFDKTDFIIFLGDFCANYFCNENLKEEEFKRDINDLGCTILVLRGNHEERIRNMILKYPYKYVSNKLESHGYEYLVPDDNWYATDLITNIEYYYEKNFPNIWYLPDGPYSFTLNGYSIFSLPGAYSIDKYYRLATGQRWFKDEQLTQEEMNEVIKYPLYRIKHFDLIISHTSLFRLSPLIYLFQTQTKMQWIKQWRGSWRKCGKTRFTAHGAEVIFISIAIMVKMSQAANT